MRQSHQAPSPCSSELSGIPGSFTEHLLTTSAGFNITTATPAQRAACRILDGVPLGDVRDHPDVAQLVGGPEALAALPPAAPNEAIFLAAIRGAKTIIAVCAGIRMALTVDVSALGPGEVPRVSIVAPKLDLSTVGYQQAIGSIHSSLLLAPYLLNDKAGVLTLRHPSGRPVELAIVAGSRAGTGLVSRWSAGVIFDEAPRMCGAEDGVVNLEHARDAVLGRLLPGAQALYIGSPWAPFGPVYDLVQQHWGKPTQAMVVMRGTGPMLHPAYWTPARCEAMRSNPTAYATDVLGEFADPEAGLLSPASVAKNTREGPLELTFDRTGYYAAAVDPSEGSATGNAWTLVIVQYIAPKGAAPAKYRVALAREFRGVRPEQCWQEIARDCRRFGLAKCTTDQYAAAANTDLAAQCGLRLRIDPATSASKLEDFTNLQTLVHSDQVELAPNPTLRADLLSVRRRVTQTGMAIVLPKTGDGRHADYAPALCAAVKAATKSGSDFSAIGVPSSFG